MSVLACERWWSVRRSWQLQETLKQMTGHVTGALARRWGSFEL